LKNKPVIFRRRKAKKQFNQAFENVCFRLLLIAPNSTFVNARTAIMSSSSFLLLFPLKSYLITLSFAATNFSRRCRKTRMLLFIRIFKNNLSKVR